MYCQNMGYPYLSFAPSWNTANTTPILQNTGEIGPISLQATVDDIAIWIYELAKFQGWENPATYGELFKKYKVDGRMIFGLKNEDLRDGIQIKKLGHRLKILQAIEKSLANISANVSSQGSSAYNSSQGSNVESAPVRRDRRDRPRSHKNFTTNGRNGKDCKRSKTFSDLDSRRRKGRKGNSHRESGTKSGKKHRVRSAGTKKFSRSRRSPQTFSSQTGHIRSVNSIGKIFQTEKMNRQHQANDARLEEGEDMRVSEELSLMNKSRGSYIDPKPESKQEDYLPPLSDSASCSSVSGKKSMTPRASPGNPKTYKVKRDTTIQKGKKLTSKTVKELFKGETVLVNQLKKRRARVINQSGTVIGWTSTHDKNERLLLPC